MPNLAGVEARSASGVVNRLLLRQEHSLNAGSFKAFQPQRCGLMSISVIGPVSHIAVMATIAFKVAFDGVRLTSASSPASKPSWPHRLSVIEIVAWLGEPTV